MHGVLHQTRMCFVHWMTVLIGAADPVPVLLSDNNLDDDLTVISILAASRRHERLPRNALLEVSSAINGESSIWQGVQHMVFIDCPRPPLLCARVPGPEHSDSSIGLPTGVGVEISRAVIQVNLLQHQWVHGCFRYMHLGISARIQTTSIPLMAPVVTPRVKRQR